MTLLSLRGVALTYAKLKDGTIVESPTFDVGEALEVVSEDGTKSPAPNGFHELALKDEEGNETYIKVRSEEGVIVERENVEMEDIETEPIPQTNQPNPDNEVPTAEGSVTDGTQTLSSKKVKMEDEEVSPIPADTDAPEEELTTEDIIEKLQYRIEELEKKFQKLEEVEVEVETESDDEEELPKLDGAPIEASANSTRLSAATKGRNSERSTQSRFLDKLYK
tara:strand:+ start:621 stop:1286 length:666 start_codon:yes stop_codon:yes gene_type:complete